MTLAADHGGELSVSLIKRRVPLITGHEAALLAEFAKRLRVEPGAARKARLSYVDHR